MKDYQNQHLITKQKSLPQRCNTSSANRKTKDLSPLPFEIIDNGLCSLVWWEENKRKKHIFKLELHAFKISFLPPPYL